MRFLSGPVRVAVPATSANLGPGFDTLGLALDLHDEISAEVTGTRWRIEVEGEGAGELPDDENHLVAATMLTAFDLMGADRPAGLLLRCRNRIPHARGLGSSSAAIVAGITLARALAPDLAGAVDPLSLATKIEGHPDNVAPCLLGGFVIAWTGPDGAHAVRLAPAAGVQATVFVPDERGLTAHARAALPATVPHADASFNAGRTALLVHALTAAPELLYPATEDRLHQGYRAGAMPATAALVARLRAAGVPAVVSGAGPTVLAFATDAQEAARWESDIEAGWWAKSLKFSSAGARILSAGHAEADPVAAGGPR